MTLNQIETDAQFEREEIEQLAFLDAMLDDVDATREIYHAWFTRYADKDEGEF